MPAPAPPLRRGPAERVQAWLVTGPLGHFWSVAADLAMYGAQRFVRRTRRRLRGGRRSAQ